MGRTISSTRKYIEIGKHFENTIPLINTKTKSSKVCAFFHRKSSLLLYDIFFCKRTIHIYLHTRELFMFLLSSADFLQNKFLANKPLRTTIRVSNSLDTDQDQFSVGLYLGSNRFQKAIGRRQNAPLACKEFKLVNTLLLNVLSHTGTFHF